MKKKSLSLTVGIPTYYGGPSLVKTVKSILSSKGVGKFRLIVSVDGNPLQKNIQRQLEDLSVEVINNKERGGQVARIKQIISLTKSDILITTQDDVIFAPNTIREILKTFKDNLDVTMIGAKLEPLPATTLLQKFLQTGVRITYRIGTLWRKGDNYLLSSGRCLAYRTKIAKKTTIPDEVINCDAYPYFENKLLGGKFRHVPEAVVFNKSPQTIAEHLKQSKRFQNSREEISQFLDIDQEKEYLIPRSIALRALIEELVKNPLNTAGYLGILLHTRLVRKDEYKKVKRFWETDLSTKQVR